MLHIVELMIPGTMYELFTHAYLKKCIKYHMYPRRYGRCDVPRIIYDTRRTYEKQEKMLLSVEAVYLRLPLPFADIGKIKKY